MDLQTRPTEAKLDAALEAVTRCLEALPDDLLRDGETAFEILARELARSLSVRAALIAVSATQDCDRLKTLAAFVDGRFVRGVELRRDAAPTRGLDVSELRLLEHVDASELPDVLGDAGADFVLTMMLHDRAGNPVGAVLAANDSPIQDPDFASRILKTFAHRARLELERRAMELDLFEARKLGEEAARAKSEFIANVSHEIRTPMNGVFGLLSLLKEMELGDEQEDLVRTALTASQDLMNVIGEMLDFSKIEVGRLRLKVAELDFEELVRGVVSDHADQARDKGLSLRLEGDGDALAVCGDRKRVRQILRNLLTNAIKFTEAGEVVVRWEMKPRGFRRVRATVEVEDTGVGIAPEWHETIFQPFWQQDGSFTRRYEGSGLGLAVAQQLAALMEGEIVVDSDVGKGTRFTVKLTLDAVLSGEDSETIRESGLITP